MTHSPKFFGVMPGKDGKYDIFDQDSEPVAIGLDKDDANLFVKAVNAHDNLIAALRHIQENSRSDSTVWLLANAALARVGA